jgi:hypothetical protein
MEGRPFSPIDVAAAVCSRTTVVPAIVFDAANTMLVETTPDANGMRTIYKTAIKRIVTDRLNTCITYNSAYVSLVKASCPDDWLNFEHAYRRQGWRVALDPNDSDVVYFTPE